MPHGMAKIETKKIFNVKKKLKVTLKTGKGALSFLNKLQNYQILKSMCTCNFDKNEPWNFLGSKTTADGDCSHEIKRCLFLGRKAMTNLDSILKSRDITLLTKVHLVKAMAFPVIMYGCESWTIKKAEHRRTDAFELWC